MSTARNSFRCIIAMTALGCAQVAHADLVGWWTFENVAGDLVPDSSPFKNDGTLMSGASLSSDVPSLLAGGHSLSLDGGSQHVLVEHDDSLNIEDALTIAAWVKPIGGVEWDGVLAKSPSDDSQPNHAGNYELRIENGTRTMTYLNQQGGVDDTIGYGGGPQIADSTWTHVAVTVDSDGISFYRNGILASTRALGGAGVVGVPNSNPLYIGSRADLFTTMNGLLDDVRVYSNVLSADEIRQLAGVDAPTPPANLIAATIHSVSSELVTSFRRGAENLVNGSGLYPDGSHSISPDGNMWLNAGNGCCGDEADPLAPAAEVVFDLGSTVAIDHMKLWNYNETLPNRDDLLLRGVAKMDILTAGDDLVFKPFASNVDVNSGAGDELVDFGQNFGMSGTSARYVKLSLLSNLGGDNDFIGLSEVQFFKGGSTAGDFNKDGQLDELDINLLTKAVIAGANESAYDVDGNGKVDSVDHDKWITDIKKTWSGDADMNGEFNTTDLVQVFQRGQYEDTTPGNSGWGDGDWNGDTDFDSGDLVNAFQAGGYEQGPLGSVQAVPEPGASSLFVAAVLTFAGVIRRRNA